MSPQQEAEEPVPFQHALPIHGAVTVTATGTVNGMFAPRNPIAPEKTIAQTGTGAIATWVPQTDHLLQPAMQDRIRRESVQLLQ